MNSWQKWIITVVVVGVITGGAWMLFGDHEFSGSSDIEIDLEIETDEEPEAEEEEAQ